MFRVKLLLASLLLISCVSAQGQSKYTVYNRQLTINADGSIHLNGIDNDGIAWVNGMQFTKGTIEFDVKGQDVLQQSFLGIAFHGVNDTTFEVIYFRPFNFKATDPERHAHAVQYVAVPGFDWPKLRAEHHNQYEKPLPNPPDPNGWFHVRIKVDAELVSVFVNDDAAPALAIKPLVHTDGKRIGFWVGNGSPGNFKGLKLSGN